MTGPIRTERRGAVLEVTIDRPKANAIDAATSRIMGDIFAQFRDDADLRVAILTAAGERFFCPGWDLKAAAAGEAPDSDYGVGGFGGLQELPGLNKPVIGAINGAAITGGFELALACDVLFASTQARFADTHARVGVMPGWGLSQKLSRAVGIYRAKELSLTGNFLSAEQALAWGLVNRVVEPAELLPQARALARDMLSVIPEMLVSYKRVIDDGYAASFGEGMAIEAARAREANVHVRADQIEQRREAVRARAHALGAGGQPG